MSTHCDGDGAHVAPCLKIDVTVDWHTKPRACCAITNNNTTRLIESFSWVLGINIDLFDATMGVNSQKHSLLGLSCEQENEI
jgi:hypothetical protein